MCAITYTCTCTTTAGDWGPVAGVGGRVGKSGKSGISHGKGEGHVVHAGVMCVAPPTHVGAWSMTVLLGQPFEYYYIFMYQPLNLGELSILCTISHVHQQMPMRVWLCTLSVCYVLSIQVPAGLFIPSMFVGACMGRILGICMEQFA